MPLTWSTPFLISSWFSQPEADSSPSMNKADRRWLNSRRPPRRYQDSVGWNAGKCDSTAHGNLRTLGDGVDLMYDSVACMLVLLRKKLLQQKKVIVHAENQTTKLENCNITNLLADMFRIPSSFQGLSWCRLQKSHDSPGVKSMQDIASELQKKCLWQSKKRCED